jgi:hypothetical protein
MATHSSESGSPDPVASTYSKEGGASGKENRIGRAKRIGATYQKGDVASSCFRSETGPPPSESTRNHRPRGDARGARARQRRASRRGTRATSAGGGPRSARRSRRFLVLARQPADLSRDDGRCPRGRHDRMAPSLGRARHSGDVQHHVAFFPSAYVAGGASPPPVSGRLSAPTSRFVPRRAAEPHQKLPSAPARRGHRHVWRNARHRARARARGSAKATRRTMSDDNRRSLARFRCASS